MTLAVVLGLVFALGWVPLYVFRVEARRASLPAYTRSERLWARLAPGALAVHMTGACVTVSVTPAITLWPAGLAITLFAAAVAFWFWGRTMIGPLRARPLPDEPPRQLQRTGAFGIVRHPLYFGYLLAAAAPLVVAPKALLALTFFLCFAALAMRAVQEERRLRAQVGAAYDAYCRDVKRLVPFVW